jgi:hypothetical protein
MNLSSVTRLAAAVLAGSLYVQAGTNTLAVPFYRGSTGSAYAGWDTFTVATDNGVGNAPQFAGGANARLIQLDPNAVVLGSGNIYNQAHISRFEIRGSASEAIGLLNLSVRGVGNEIDYSTIRLSYQLGATPVESFFPRIELERTPLGPPGAGGGFAVTSYVEWNLIGLGVTDYTIKFEAADVSLSLDSAVVDTLSSTQAQLVPEPQTWALLGAGVALLAARHWRRR